MKNILKLSTFILLGTLLTGCNGNAGAGKSYTYDSMATTFTVGTETDFFSAEYNVFYKNEAEFEGAIKTKLLSPTNNGKINIGDTAASNKTIFKGKETKIYPVNEAKVDDIVSNRLCNYGVDPENKDTYHLYDQGTIGAENVIEVDLYHLMNSRSRVTSGSLTSLHTDIYTLVTTDTGIKVDKNEMTINLVSNLTYSRDNEVIKAYACSTVVTFKA